MKKINQPIYHIIHKDDWKKIKNLETYHPGSLDQEGFIHFSFAEQIHEVVCRYYPDSKDLLVIKVLPKKLTSKLLIENVHGAGDYPHLYGELNLNAVENIFELYRNENGRFTWKEGD